MWGHLTIRAVFFINIGNIIVHLIDCLNVFHIILYEQIMRKSTILLRRFKMTFGRYYSEHNNL